MRKFIAVLSIFLFLSFNIDTITAKAEAKYLEQGFYKVKDIGLVTNTAYNIRNTSPSGRAIVIVFDGNQLMQEFLRLEPNSQSYLLRPLGFDYIIVIVGGGKIEFS